jgi:hypothetical protein
MASYIILLSIYIKNRFRGKRDTLLLLVDLQAVLYDPLDITPLGDTLLLLSSWIWRNFTFFCKRSENIILVHLFSLPKKGK